MISEKNDEKLLICSHGEKDGFVKFNSFFIDFLDIVLGE